MGDGEGADGEEGEWVTDSEEEGSDADSDFMGGRSDDEYDEVPELQPFDVSLSLLFFCRGIGYWGGGSLLKTKVAPQQLKNLHSLVQISKEWLDH